MEPDESLVADLWWMGVAQGVLAVFFGLAAIFWPSLTLAVLIFLVSAFLIVIGFAEMIYGLVSIGKNSTWWLIALVGVVSLSVGVYLIRHPETTLQTFMIIIGLVLIARGLIDLVRSFSGRDTGTDRTLTIIIGVLAVIAGIAILAQPVAGGVAFVWILGLYALLYGALSIVISYRVRRVVDR